MNKFVVCGYKESGKTTLITRIMQSWQGEFAGFSTRKFPDRLTEDGLCPIYIFPVGSDPIFDDAHLIGLGGHGTHYTNIDVFNTVGRDLLTVDKPDTLILIDEVGFLESEAKIFQEKIFEILESPNPVVLAMKQKKQLDFMEKIKAFPGIEYFELNPENRDEVYEKIRTSFLLSPVR